MTGFETFSPYIPGIDGPDVHVAKIPPGVVEAMLQAPQGQGIEYIAGEVGLGGVFVPDAGSKIVNGRFVGYTGKLHNPNADGLECNMRVILEPPSRVAVALAKLVRREARVRVTAFTPQFK